jgi:hypothetical protein
MSDTNLGAQTEALHGTRVAVVLSLIALFLSGWSFIASMDDDAQLRDVERRLACLELPGANDCGADGR